MAKDGETFEHWLDRAKIPQSRRSPRQLAILEATFAFLQQAGQDYASRRIAAHFLLNCQSGLKLAQVGRLVGVTRPTASRQNNLTSRQVIREIQHQLSGRPYGKLLPRYAGPIAQFLVTHPEARRDDVLDFIQATFGIHVSLTSLHNYLKQYGLDRQSLNESAVVEPPHPAADERTLLEAVDHPPASGLPVPLPPDDFFLATPPTPAPSCCSPKSSTGGKSPSSASRMNTARCNAGS
jgi:hypothetical protein